MRPMAKTKNGTGRLSREEMAALTRPAEAKSPKEKRETVERATRGLRVDVRVTPSLYGRK
jgi:hypothetical protein